VGLIHRRRGDVVTKREISLQERRCRHEEGDLVTRRGDVVTKKEISSRGGGSRCRRGDLVTRRGISL
jgi:hypothetical protein